MSLCYDLQFKFAWEALEEEPYSFTQLLLIIQHQELQSINSFKEIQCQDRMQSTNLS